MPYGRGFGFRGWSPPWPHVGLGRGGLPRCWAYGPYPYEAPFGPGFSGYTPWYGSAMAPEFGPPLRPEEEKQMLQEQVAFLKTQLEEISKRIEELEQKSEGEK
jgi:hypothetical protein